VVAVDVSDKANPETVGAVGVLWSQGERLRCRLDGLLGGG
jgi:hypothetical protein